MSRPRRDIDDIDRHFGRDEAEEIRRDQAEARASAETRTQQQAEVDARAAESARAFTQRVNESAILREYERAGVEPVRVSEGGNLVSLALLIRLGWKIEVLGSVRTLVKPAAEPKPKQGEELGR